MGYIVAAAILALLVIGFTRKTVLVMAVLVALVFASVGIYLALESRREHRIERLMDGLVMTVAYDPSCDLGKPVRIALRNDTGRRVEAVTFDIAAYRAGHSIPLYRTRGYVSDRILDPDGGWEECWPMPDAIRGTDTSGFAENPPETLRWEVENRTGTFAPR
ncbi:hypothetical protein [Falsirhodobacter sp. 20TX0035]|uniref:hypothetical protein n=1 Tax=Falsirhodobacter sp. 20TX0035 TaxID=3022019 RepID=UPI00232C5934|nr:hypothetical protein [Falsirhodobacter sp. 20TX0035]MDB6452987.1 hypothetical protein [Falsirhodobacter sp. 20TX0035]